MSEGCLERRTSRENTSDAVKVTNGTSLPSVCAMAGVSGRTQPSTAVLTHRDGGLAGTGRTSNQDRPAGNAALLHHLEDDAGGLARLALADHALRGRTGLEVGVKAESVDVRVDTCGQR